MEYLIGIILGVLLGFSGAGGSVFCVPLLALLMGMPLSQAMGTALGAVSISALYGAICQRKRVLWKQGLVLAITGVAFAPFGRMLSLQINELWLSISFFVLAAFISVVMWKKTPSSNTNAEDLCCEFDFQNAKIALKNALPFSVGSGALIGLVSGLLGVGGGLFIVPFLNCVLRLSLAASVATSLFIISLVSGSGFISHIILVNDVELFLLLKIIITGIIGFAIGQRLSNFYRDNSKQRILAVLLSVIAGITLVSKTQL